MSTTNTNMDLVTARALADKLIARLGPSCERIEVAGSVRRGKRWVGDLELVAIPRTIGQVDLFGQVGQRTSLLDRDLDHLVTIRHISRQPPPGWATTLAWGPRQKKFWLKLSDRLGIAQVDLYITTPESWGAIFCIRTGPQDFSEALVAHFKFRTPYRQQDGMLVRQDTGEAVPVLEEDDYFRLAGIPWIPPDRRSAQALRNRLHLARLAAAKTGPEALAGGETPAHVAGEPDGGLRYTDDVTVRRAIRARLEQRAGLLVTNSDLMPLWAAGLTGLLPDD